MIRKKSFMIEIYVNARSLHDRVCRMLRITLRMSCIIFISPFFFLKTKHKFHIDFRTFCIYFSDVHTCNNFTSYNKNFLIWLAQKIIILKNLGGAEKLVRAISAALLCWAQSEYCYKHVLTSCCDPTKCNYSSKTMDCIFWCI